MLAQLDEFDSGWIGISLAFSCEELTHLIRKLNDLKSGTVGHFHIRSDDFSADRGIVDIELSLLGDDEQSNMTIE